MTVALVRWVHGKRRGVELRTCGWAPCGKRFYARTDALGKYCSNSCTCAAANAANPRRLLGRRLAGLRGRA